MKKNFIKLYLLSLGFTGCLASIVYIFYHIGWFNVVLCGAVAGFSCIAYTLYNDLKLYKTSKY